MQGKVVVTIDESEGQEASINKAERIKCSKRARTRGRQHFKGQVTLHWEM